MPKSIPPFRYYFPESEIRRITERTAEVLRTNSFLTLGRYVDEFESAFAASVGSRYAAAVANGTAALEIIFRHIGVKGRKVIVPTNTFAASVFAVIHAGGEPEFADCMDDLTVDPDDVERRIDPQTAAILSVHVGGLVSPATRRLRALAADRDIRFIEDAAHAHGSRLGGKHAGTFGLAGAFSFFTTKVITTGEGGMIVTDDDGLYRHAKLLRDQAKVGGQNHHEEIGYNWRMSEFQAILGLSQLQILPELLRRRKAIAARYEVGLSDISRVRLLPLPDDVEHNFYKYVLFLDGITPGELQRRLREKYDIRMGGTVYDRPCHLQPAFQAFAKGTLPRSERLCPGHVCPPIYHEMSESDIDYVISALRAELQ